MARSFLSNPSHFSVCGEVSDEEVLAAIQSVPIHFAPDDDPLNAASDMDAVAAQVATQNQPASGAGTATPVQTPGQQSAAPAGIEGTSAGASAGQATQAAAAGTEPAAAAAAATPAAAQAAAGFDSVLAYARAQGYKIPEGVQDDAQYLEHLEGVRRQAEQLAPLAPHLQSFTANAAEFQRWQAEQAKVKAEAERKAQEKPKWWNPPEFNAGWRDQLVADPATGAIQLKPGADPAILQKYLAWQQHRRDWTEKLISDPEGALSAMVDQRAQALVEKTLDARMTQLDERTYAQQFVSTNSQWLFVHDDKGSMQRDPQGNPKISPAGARFYEHLQTAANTLGITDSRKQEMYARSMLERDILAEEARGSRAAAASKQQEESVLQKNRQAPNASGSQVGQQVPGVGTPQNQNLSLQEQLLQSLSAAGVTDADIAASER